MSALRTAGRVALSWVFVSSGIDVLQHPEKPAETAGWLFDNARTMAPVPMPADVLLVRANAAAQVVAGAALAAGIGERLAATALIGSLVPTTIGGHAFWRHDDAVLRKTNRVQFGKNAGLLGGLLALLGTPTTAQHSTTEQRRFRKGGSS